jgi:hypothetical protein
LGARPYASLTSGQCGRVGRCRPSSTASFPDVQWRRRTFTRRQRPSTRSSALRRRHAPSAQPATGDSKKFLVETRQSGGDVWFLLALGHRPSPEPASLGAGGREAEFVHAAGRLRREPRRSTRWASGLSLAFSAGCVHGVAWYVSCSLRVRERRGGALREKRT